jgi:hypothetical protein
MNSRLKLSARRAPKVLFPTHGIPIKMMAVQFLFIALKSLEITLFRSSIMH